jgi:predicted Rossmann fold nucleotide-binding protein DprA/Smf involved in DNA uptake
VSFQNLTPERLPGVLLAAAVVASRKDLNHHIRSSIISHVPPFNIHSLADASEALNIAFHKAGVSVRARRRLTAKAFAASSKKAGRWLRDGIFMLTRDDMNARSTWMHDLPPVLFALGKKSLLQLPAATILNSRKPRRISPDDRWLVETKRLVRRAIAEGFAIISSYGNIPYCTVSRLSQGYPMIVICDDVLPHMATEKAALDFISGYHDLFHLDTTLFVSPFPPGGRPGSGVRSVQRDRLVAGLSSTLFVAEVREGGNMHQIIDIAMKTKVPIIGYPTCPSISHRHASSLKKETVAITSSLTENADGNILQPGRKPTQQTSAKSEKNSSVDFFDLSAALPWLIHYTRSRPGPWPGQTIAEYCESLVEGHKGACHTAFDTLVHILEERLIRASNRLTRGFCGVVSFSECLPPELDTLIKWRKGLCRWSFEPYGIAFPRESLADPGVAPAIYGSKEDYTHLPDNMKHLFQAQRSASDDWTAEREWRVMGDLTLSHDIFREMVVIVPTRGEAMAVALEFGCKVALAGIGGQNGMR